MRFELGFGLAVALGLVALDAMWLLDYLESGQISPGGRVAGTFTGWVAGLFIAVSSAVALGLLATVLRSIYRKRQE